jgi:hypothetical protein
MSCGEMNGLKNLILNVCMPIWTKLKKRAITNEQTKLKALGCVTAVHTHGPKMQIENAKG